MYTCTLNPTYSDAEFKRVFDDSWPKMSEIFSGISQESVCQRQSDRLKKMDCVIATYDDGFLLSLYAGVINENKVSLVSAFFGKDQSGSKSYLYNDQWLQAAENTIKSNFSEMTFTTIDNTSIDNHAKAKKPIFIEAYTSMEQDEAGEDDNGTIYNALSYKT